MAISVREVLQGIAVGGDLDLTTGASTDATDVLVVTHSTHFYTLADMDPPTPGTWALATQADNGDDRVKIKVWVRVAGSAGAQTITLPPVNDTHTFGRLRVLAGADNGSPVDAAAGADGFGSQAAPSVAPATADAFLCCDWIGDNEFTYTAPPSGMTASGTQLQDFSTAYGAHEQLSASGATGTRTPTTSASVSWAATSVAIATAAGGPVEAPIGAAAETDAANPVAAAKQAAAVAAAEADQANPVAVSRHASVAPSGEVDDARPATAAKTAALAASTETDAARPVTAVRRVTIGAASEHNQTRPVAAVSTIALGVAGEVDQARQAAVVKAAALAAAVEHDTAKALFVPGGPILLGVARTADAARPVTAIYLHPVGVAQEADQAAAVGLRKVATLGPGREVDNALAVTGPPVMAVPAARGPVSFRSTTAAASSRSTTSEVSVR